MNSKIIYQSILFVSLFLGINYFISSYVAKRDPARISQIELRNSILKETKLKTLIMGDSQALRGINPQKFINAYSYASMGENGILTYYKLIDLFKTKKDIKDLILTLNLHSFSDYRGDLFTKIYLWRELVNFIELAIEKKDPCLFVGGFIRAYFFVYEHLGRGMFQTEVNDRDKPIVIKMNYYKGFAPLTFEKFNDVTDRTEKYFARKNPYDTSLINYHQKIFELCRQKGITVHLVRMPITKEFYTKASKYINDYDYLALMNQFKSQYENLRFYDLINLFEDNKEMFFDDLHLNHRGAGKLSKHLRSLMYKQDQAG